MLKWIFAVLGLVAVGWVKGQTVFINQSTNQVVPNLKVLITHPSGQLATEIVTDSAGRINYPLNKNQKYLIAGSEYILAPFGANSDTVYVVEKMHYLEEILVTSPKSEIIKPMPPTNAQAMQELASISLEKRGFFNATPVIRGLRYEQINQVFDGGIKTAHACPNRMDPSINHMSPEETEKIELIKGPFSVRLGPVAGPVLNIITKRVEHTAAPTFGAQTFYGFNANGHGHQARLSTTYANKNTDLRVYGGLKDFGNYHSGNNTEVPSSFKVYDFGFKAGYNPDANSRLQISASHNRAIDVLHAALPMDAPLDAATIASADYSSDNFLNFPVKLNSKTYFTNVDHIMDNRQRKNNAVTDAITTTQSKTVGGKIELQFKSGKNANLFLGTDYIYIARTGNRIRTVFKNPCTGQTFNQPKVFTDPVWQNTYQHNTGLFTEWRMKTKHFEYQLGARLDNARTGRNDLTGVVITPTDSVNKVANINYTLNGTLTRFLSENSNVAIKAARGIREPNLIERYIYHMNIGRDNFEYMGNPNLLGETVNELDIEFKTLYKSFVLSATVFASVTHNFIQATIDSGTKRLYLPCQAPTMVRQYNNVGDLQRIGTEFEVISPTYKLSNGHYLVAQTWASFTYAQLAKSNQALPEMPPLQGFASAQYFSPFKGLSAKLSMLWAADQYRIDPTFGEQPSYAWAIANLMVLAEPIKQLTVGFEVVNLLNHNYTSHLNRPLNNQATVGQMYEPGRGLNFFINYRIARASM